MTTTSLKLPNELKENIHPIAAQCNTSPHARAHVTICCV